MLEADWRNKKRKYSCTTFIQKDCKNSSTWQINSWVILLTEIDKNADRVIRIIFDIGNIYTKYLNQANNTSKKCNHIHIVALR